MSIFRQLTKMQVEFMKVFKEYGDEIADNGNIMAETGWDRRQVVRVGMGLVKRGILEYSSTGRLGHEGGIWSRTKLSKKQRQETKDRDKAWEKT